MEKTSYDVIVVGAGPAGSTCAWFLARDGLRVLLVDAGTFPRDKVCGDGLTPTKAIPLLREMGLLQRMEKLPQVRCDELLLVSSTGRSLCLKLQAPGKAQGQVGRVCRRVDFDAWLLEEARKLTFVMEGFQVTGLLREDHRVVGVVGCELGTGKQQQYRARVVVGADGVNSVVGKHAGLPKGGAHDVAIAMRGYFEGLDVVSNRSEMHFLRGLIPGYLWIFPAPGGWANVGLGLLKTKLERSPGGLMALFDRLVSQTPTLRERFRNAHLVGSWSGWPLPIWARRQALSTDGVLMIGDAARLIDPLTGEGIGNAMLSGRLAALAIQTALKGGDPSEERLRQYDDLLWQAIGRELLLGRMLQRVLSRQWSIDFAIALAASNRLFHAFVQQLAQPPEGKRRLLCRRGIWDLLKATGASFWASGDVSQP